MIWALILATRVLKYFSSSGADWTLSRRCLRSWVAWDSGLSSSFWVSLSQLWIYSCQYGRLSPGRLASYNWWKRGSHANKFSIEIDSMILVVNHAFQDCNKFFPFNVQLGISTLLSGLWVIYSSKSVGNILRLGYRRLESHTTSSQTQKPSSALDWVFWKSFSFYCGGHVRFD